MMQRWLLLAATAFPAISHQAIAGTIVEQTVKVSLNGTSHLSRHVWHIENGKFDLAVTSGSDNGSTSERHFIFNGRVMYLCGKLDPKQLHAIGDLNVNDAALEKKFRAGVCQEVPSNFLVRFFLSPVSAIESIDLSDGLKLTLAIQEFNTSPTQSKKIAGQDTNGFSRNFSMTKSGANGKTVQTIKESFFAGGKESVRQTIWPELSKILTRQPKGVQLLQALKQDRDRIHGMILESETIFESELPSGAKLRGTISAATSRYEASDMRGRQFRVPENYAIFSPENLKSIARSTPDTKANDAGKKHEADLNILDKVQSVFFCAISGALGCFSR